MLRPFLPAFWAVLAVTLAVSPAQAIVGGERDTAEPGVVSVLIQHEKDPTPETSFQCSGTLVAPHVVVTAAHCVHEKFVGQGQSFYAFFGDDVNANDQLSKRTNFGYAVMRVARVRLDSLGPGEVAD